MQYIKDKEEEQKTQMTKKLGFLNCKLNLKEKIQEPETDVSKIRLPVSMRKSLH